LVGRADDNAISGTRAGLSRVAIRDGCGHSPSLEAFNTNG